MCLISFQTNSQHQHSVCSLYVPHQLHPKLHALGSDSPTPSTDVSAHSLHSETLSRMAPQSVKTLLLYL